MHKTILIFLLCSSLRTLSQRPIRFFHGLGSECERETHISNKINGGLCVESGGRFRSYYDLRKQAKRGCKKLKQEQAQNKGIFDNGLYLIGFSQGGLIARLIYKNCDLMYPPKPNTLPIRDLIKRIITIGTPNMGINKLPDLINPQLNQEDIPEEYRDGWLKTKLKKYLINKAFENTKLNKKSILCPFSYINKIKENGDFFYSKIISELLQDDYSKLELITAITFIKDSMISPLNSMSFGAYYQNDKFEPFTETDTYKNKYSKLNELYDSGRFFNCRSNEDHLQLNDLDFSFISKFTYDCLDNDDIKDYKNCLFEEINVDYEITKRNQENYFEETFTYNAVDYLNCEFKPYKEVIII